MTNPSKEDERVLNTLLSDEAAEGYPVLFTTCGFSVEMQKELALLVLRAYQAGKAIGSRK